MKNYLLKPISACLIALAFFTACNKERIDPNDPDGSASVQLINDDPSRTGSVTGTILPTEADPTVYMRGNTEVKLDVNPDGSIAKNSVPAGDYTVQIHPSNPEYGDAMFNDIRVEAGKTTDLGKIVLVKITR